ncbi:hypothetical protein QJS10_CPB19g01804 [Acorus calamus]|uniref:Glutaredoxin-like protein n=1 Tax=Acorus calamus TaxID=4465 RepID=A0AAV9CIC4_ACOCL|nr:hypothetical protein QJS10_CPB19g01804 [Acorus calamus]
MAASMASTQTLTVASLTRRRPPHLLLSSTLRWPFRRPFSATSTRADPTPPPPSARSLVLYTKPGCCLCDGLKEKLGVAFSLGGPDSLHGVRLQMRDITENPEWERRYQYEIPVLARLLPDGSEEILPRLSPRVGAELLQKKLAAALRQ